MNKVIPFVTVEEDEDDGSYKYELSNEAWRVFITDEQ